MEPSGYGLDWHLGGQQAASSLESDMSDRRSDSARPASAQHQLAIADCRIWNLRCSLNQEQSSKLMPPVLTRLYAATIRTVLLAALLVPVLQNWTLQAATKLKTS